MQRLAITTGALAALLVLASISTTAGSAPTIGWGDTSPGGSQDLDYDCTSPDSVTLVMSFTAPAGIDSLFGLLGHIDFCTDPHPLPAWWRFESGGCREGDLDVTADFVSGPPTHSDPWQGQAGVVFTFIPEHLNVVRARIDVEVSIAPENAQPLVEGEDYYGFAVTFAVPSAACAGCELPSCFVINDYVTLLHSGGETRLWGDNYSNYARWQGGTFDCPFIISVESETWGRIKTLYRPPAR